MASEKKQDLMLKEGASVKVLGSSNSFGCKEHKMMEGWVLRRQSTWSVTTNKY